MPMFAYQASNLTGEVIKDTIEAADEAAAIAYVQSQNLIPIKIQKSSKLSLSMNIGGKPKIKKKTVAIFTMELATLLEAGLPLDRSINILIGMEESPEWRLVLEDLLARIKSGSTLSGAMKEHDKVFSDFYVGLVHAGELSGSLNVVLDRLADYLEKNLETQSAIKKALFYPAMLITVGLGVVAYLLLAVIPKFSEIIERNGSDVPFISDIIFMMSAGLRNYWYVILGVLLIIYAWVRGQLKSPTKRDKLDARLLKMPLFGDLIRKSEFAKLTRTLGTMLTHGVPLSLALRSVQESVGNKVLGETIDAAMQSLKGGRGMARVLIESKAFPTLGVQMVRVGEETGKLEKMLMKVADIYDKEVKNTTEAIVSTIGPIAILSIAGMIALIMAGVVMALFSLS